MSNETKAPENGYLICKYGMFYRPDSCGYTSAKSEAGRYSLNMAIDITHPNGPDGPRDGMTYIHETEVADPRADLSDAKDKRPNGCVAGCMVFDGGERKHHKDCAAYPESLTKLWHDTEAEYQARIAKLTEELEAQLTIARSGLHECEQEIDDYIRQEYPHDHPVQERYRQRDFSSNPARVTLAELKGPNQ